MQIAEVQYNGETYQVWYDYEKGIKSSDWREPSDPDTFEVVSIWPDVSDNSARERIGDLAYELVKD